MVTISDISDDGSNGDDQTKKPQEDEEDKQIEKPNQSQNHSISSSILVERYNIQYLHRFHHNPTPPPIAAFFLHLMASPPRLIASPPRLIASLPGLHGGDVITQSSVRRRRRRRSHPYLRRLRRLRSYLRRHRRRHCRLRRELLYAFVGFPTLYPPEWRILRVKPNRIFLETCRFDSLPHLPFGSAVVTIGSEMYLFGGRDGSRNRSSGVIIMNCRARTWQFLPNMRRERYRAAAGVIDGNIYVIGGCEFKIRSSGLVSDWIEVFDVKNRVWNLPIPAPYPYAGGIGEFVTYVVMNKKIYVLDPCSCFSYDPKTRKWESWLGEGGLRSLWQESCCVVDDLLFTIDPLSSLGHQIVVYDPKEEDWRGVDLGESGVDLPCLFYYKSKMAKFGGKLVILGCKQSLYPEGQKDIVCVIIALYFRRRERVEFCGIVESVKCVLTSPHLPSIELCRTPTV